MLAAHAAVAIENARLYERNRDLVVVAERNRLAATFTTPSRGKLFSAALTAETAATLVERDAAAAKVEMRRAGELLSEATAELRALIFELRPPELDRDGLQETLRKHVDVLRRVERAPVELDITCDGRLPAKLEEGFHRSPRRHCTTPSDTPVPAASTCGWDAVTDACGWRCATTGSASTRPMPGCAPATWG